MVIRWYVLIPITLIFFNYVFGVAVEVLGQGQLYLRVSVIIICIVNMFFIGSRARSIDFLYFYIFCIYMLLVYGVNQSVIVINFIYMGFILFYLSLMRVSHEELFYNSLIASVVVIIIYISYFFVSGLDIGVVTISGRTRYYFGFTNPNKIGIVAYSLVGLSLLQYKRMNIAILLSVILVSIFCALLSGSRTALLSILLLITLSASHRWMIFKNLTIVVPLILLIISLYIAEYHDNEVLNKILSNRPVDFNAFLSELKTFSYFYGSSAAGFRVDNSYILAYFSVGFLGYLYVSWLVMRSIVLIKDRIKIALILTTLIYGMMEGLLVRPEFPLVICFYYILFRPLNCSENLLSKGYIR